MQGKSHIAFDHFCSWNLSRNRHKHGLLILPLFPTAIILNHTDLVLEDLGPHEKCAVCLEEKRDEGLTDGDRIAVRTLALYGGMCRGWACYCVIIYYNPSRAIHRVNSAKPPG